MIAKPISILISGKAGTGKTTAAKTLKELFYYLYKEESGIAPVAWGLKTVARSMGWDGEKDQKGRVLLQELGAVGRHYNPDIWINLTYNVLARTMTCSDGMMPLPIILTDDFRFINEEKFVKSLNTYDVFTIRMEAENRELLRGTVEGLDVSETSLDNAKFDYIIHNEGSMQDLEKSCEEICLDIYYKAEKFGGLK